MCSTVPIRPIFNIIFYFLPLLCVIMCSTVPIMIFYRSYYVLLCVLLLLCVIMCSTVPIRPIFNIIFLFSFFVIQQSIRKFILVNNTALSAGLEYVYFIHSRWTRYLH